MRLLVTTFILLNLIQLQSAQTINVTLNYREGETGTISIQNLTNRSNCYFDMPNDSKMLKSQNIQPLTNLTVWGVYNENEYAMICFNETYSRKCNFYQIANESGFVYHDILSNKTSVEQFLPMPNDPMQYYPVEIRKLQEYTAFETRSKNNETSGVFLLSNSQRGVFINLLFSFNFTTLFRSSPYSLLSVPTSNPKSKILLVWRRDYVSQITGSDIAAACLFETTTNSTKNCTGNDLVSIKFGALGLEKVYIRAMEVDVSRPQVVYVLSLGTFYAFQITELNLPWNLLGNLSLTPSSYNSYECQMKKVMNYVIIYCPEGKLSRIDISDVNNPKLVDEIKLTPEWVEFGTGSFLYFFKWQEYKGCEVFVYDILSKEISLRYHKLVPSMPSCSSRSLTSFALNESAEVFGVYKGKELNFYKIPKEQTLIASIPPTVRARNVTECTDTQSPIYECAYALSLQSYCGLNPEGLTLNLKLRIMTPIYPVAALSTDNKTSVATFRPSDLFTGPIFNMKASLKPGYSNYNLAMLGPLDKTIFSPGSYKFPVISMTQYQSKIYILSGTRNSSLYFTYTNLDNRTTSSDRLQDHSITYELNLSSLSNVTVESCTISPLEVKASNVSFFLSCPVIGLQNTYIAFAYYSLNSEGKVKSMLQTERFSSILPPKNRLGENLLVTVSNPQPDGEGSFIKSMLFDPEQSGVLPNETKFEANYSSIGSYDDDEHPFSRTPINTTGILSYDLWSYNYSDYSWLKLYSYVVVALTLDQQLILSFIGESISIGRVWKLENTSFFQKDKSNGEKPNFVKVRWSESSCGGTPRPSFMLISANFYTYLIEADYLFYAASPIITVLNTFTYYPGYYPLEVRYDSCTNMLITYAKKTKTKDDGNATILAQQNSSNYNTSDGCALMVYFTNNSNAASIIDTSTINDNISCPANSISGAPFLFGKSYNEGLSLVFLSNTTLHTRYARHYCLVNVISPKNINESVDVIVNGSNSFYSAEFRGLFNVAFIPPKPSPKPSSVSWWIVAGVIVLIILVLVAAGAAAQRRKYLKRVGYQAAINEPDNHYQNLRDSKEVKADITAFNIHEANANKNIVL